jgi:hypothetical protein
MSDTSLTVGDSTVIEVDLKNLPEQYLPMIIAILQETQKTEIHQGDVLDMSLKLLVTGRTCHTYMNRDRSEQKE